jgi:hypothetical protein
MHILTTLTFVRLLVVFTRFIGRCTLGVLASLLALTYSLAYRLLLRHL